MLSKDTIESAIVLAKLIEKQGIIIPSLNEGTLLKTIFDESAMICSEVDFNIDDINDGNYDDLVEAIYKAHADTNSFINEFGEKEYEPCVHDGWMSAYSPSIAKAITNNIVLVKDVVIPDVKTLYESLIDLFNNSGIDINSGIYIIEDVRLPDFVETSCFSELVEEHSTHEPPPFGKVEIRAPFIETEVKESDELVYKYLQSGAEKLSCIQDLTKVSLEDSYNIIRTYLGTDICSEQHYKDKLNKLSPFEILTLTSFFNGVVIDPYFNSGNSGVENKQWADWHLHACLHAFFNVVKVIQSEIRDGRIVSSLNNTNHYYPKPGVAGTAKIIKVYLSNIDDALRVAKATIPVDILLAGAVVSNYDLNTITIDTLTPEFISKCTKSWNVFTKAVSESNSQRQLDKFRKSACSVINTFVNSHKTINESYVDYFELTTESPINKVKSENDIYELAKSVVLDDMYRNTNIRLVFEHLEKSLEEDVNSFNIGCSLVTKLVSNFMLEQITILY